MGLELRSSSINDHFTALVFRIASWFGFHFHRLKMLLRAVFSLLWSPLGLFCLVGLTACGENPTTLQMGDQQLQVDKSLTRIVIHKSAYKLELFEKDRLLRTYPIVLGFDPVNDKFQEGDGRTPEGTFHVRTLYDHDRWSKFIWVDYPTDESYERFASRQAAGLIPSDATIGGEIGIHGVPEGMDSLVTQHYNWTLGCISLTRADVEELYSLIQTGTEIKILH